jgi:hypothetical protein
MTRLPCHYPRPDRYPAAPGQSVKSAFRLFVRAAKKPNHRHRRLLRARRERADELAAFQLNELHSIPASSPRRRGTESRRPWPRRRRHPARRFANGRPRSSLMRQAKSRRCRVAQSRATKKGSAARRRDRQLPPTSHLEIRQLQRRYAKPLATCLAPVAVCCGS